MKTRPNFSPAPTDLHRPAGDNIQHTAPAWRLLNDVGARYEATVRAAAATSEPLPEMPD